MSTMIAEVYEALRAFSSRPESWGGFTNPANTDSCPVVSARRATAMGWVSGQAYSDDLRARVLAAVDRGGRVYEVAPLFEVSVSYIYKALARRRLCGIETALPKSGRPGRKLDRHLDALA